MPATPVEDLQKVRRALVELRRREAAQIVSGAGEVATYAAGIFNTMNWIAAIDRALEDEQKTATAAEV
jgi:hypothetical protein